MRKIQILLITFFAIAAVNASYGQAELALGIKGGINLSTLNGSSSIGSAYDNRSGYHFGAYFMFKFTKIAIQPEILFSQQGQKLTINTTTYSSNYDYVTFPVLIKFYLLAGLNLQTGVQFGFVTSSNGDLYNTVTSTLYPGQDLGSFVHSTDFSVPVGIGWDLPFGLNLTARYNIGISEVNKQSGSTAPPTLISAMGTSSAKNQVFQFSLGFRLFKFGK